MGNRTRDFATRPSKRFFMSTEQRVAWDSMLKRHVPPKRFRKAGWLGRIF
jgi:hypothetical protein